MCRVCYGFRNAPPEGFGALAYGITHPTYISKIKYDSYRRKGVAKLKSATPNLEYSKTIQLSYSAQAINLGS